MKPQIFYGMHMEPGIAEYRPKGQKPFRVFVDERVAKEMDATFPGCPVFAEHVAAVNDEVMKEADGYVVESFFNKSDGKHWSKFIVTTEHGLQAIAKGWRLSNAYFLKEQDGGGKWHNVDYDKKLLRGEYEHLAIVPNPRYEGSVILTPEQFKKYNEQREEELERLMNSKEEGVKGMFKIFKREKVENSADLENMVVELPKSKKEVVLSRLINTMDEIEVKNQSTEPVIANGDHVVEIGEEKMSVNELVEKYTNMCADKKKNEMSDEEAKKKAIALAKHEEDEIEKKKDLDNSASEEKPAEEKAENSKGKENFEKLSNAAENAAKSKVGKVFTSQDRVALGKKKYGSK